MPYFITDNLERLLAFMEQGGDVLWLIFATALVFFLLSLERLMFLLFTQPKMAKAQQSAWQNRQDKQSWYAHQIREKAIAQMNLIVRSRLHVIAILVAICPLLGLLGTVTGMIEVFDTMGSTGSGNARAMASGVSKATIPTLAGMVIAINGLFIKKMLDRKSSAAAQRFEDSLEIHHQ